MKPPTIVIVGPTASGKTSLSIDLAERYNGEIISADSRAIYRHMDIGTAKPTIAEQARVKHWGIDLVDPDECFTAYDFQQYAISKIEDIRSRGKIPFLVGGSGLYVDSVIFNYDFSQKHNTSIERSDLEVMSTEELHLCCKNNNIPLPENNLNKRYLIRAIETKGYMPNNREQVKTGFSVVGITTPKEILVERITNRADIMFNDNIVQETTFLTRRYNWNLESMKSNIYRVIDEWQSGQLTLEEAKQKFIQLDLRLVKKQLTWFKRNSQINWFTLEEAKSHIEQLLNHI